MRRFKAIYLAIILAVLWIGAGCAAYFLLLSPQFVKNKAAAGKWDTANKALVAAQSTATASASAYPTNAAKLIENYRSFRAIQATMPQIYDMKSQYNGDSKAGLQYLYQAMGRGAWIRELTRWTKGYRLAKNPTYTLSGTLGYEDTLTSVPMVEVPFSTQTFTAYGYADLINKVRKSYGYNHFPLVIAGAGIGASTSNAPAPTAQSGAPSPGMTPGMPPANGSFQGEGTNMQPPTNGAPNTVPGAGAPTAPLDGGAVSTAPAGGGGALVITVLRDHPKYNPNRPLLQMKYEAKGAFITRGWDPNQDTIASDIQNAKSWISAPPAVPPVQDPSEFPKILFFFGGQTKVD